MAEKFSQFQLGKTNKSLYLKQKWNFDCADKCLELIITDCSNYWTGTCEYLIILKLYIEYLNLCTNNLLKKIQKIMLKSQATCMTLISIALGQSLRMPSQCRHEAII